MLLRVSGTGTDTFVLQSPITIRPHSPEEGGVGSIARHADAPSLPNAYWMMSRAEDDALPISDSNKQESVSVRGKGRVTDGHGPSILNVETPTRNGQPDE